MTTRAKKLHKDLVETYGGMINEIEQRMKAGEDVPDCLAKTLIEAGQRDELDSLDMTMICSAFMIGGVESVCIYDIWVFSISSNVTESLSIPDGFSHAMVLRTDPIISGHSSTSPC
jgi:hypothetical protein